jgi:transposase-like protein
MKRIAIDEPARLDRFVKSFGSSHSEDFKGLVLKMVESGQSLESVSQLSGVSLSTLYDWVKDWNEKKRLA